jgi:ribosome-dependent ATPase
MTPLNVARLSGVTHRYGGVFAVNAVDLEIPAGRMVGFIGPDGVGKSTTLALIAGSRRIQTGKVEVLAGTWPPGVTGPRSAPASPTCRRAWARTSTRP